MTLTRRLHSDLATARARFSMLRHVATFLTLELVTALVSGAWGLVVLLPGSLFGARRYAGFDAADENSWGAYFAALCLISIFVTLTRSREARLTVAIASVLSWSQVVWRLADAPLPLAPAPVVYALLGCALPIVVAAWHGLHLVFDDIEGADEHVRAQWLEPERPQSR